MANMYRSVLATGGAAPTGNAQPAEVISGKTFENSDGPQTGTMPNNGAVSGQATPSQPYTIPAGYHNGSGVVTASGVELNYEVSISGTSTLTLGTDFTVGKHYQIAIMANNVPTSYVGGTLNKRKIITGGVIVDLTATATTMTASGGSQYTGTTVISEY